MTGKERETNSLLKEKRSLTATFICVDALPTIISLLFLRMHFLLWFSVLPEQNTIVMFTVTLLFHKLPPFEREAIILSEERF